MSDSMVSVATNDLDLLFYTRAPETPFALLLTCTGTAVLDLVVHVVPVGTPVLMYSVLLLFSTWY